jgi:hypothetical protein
MRIRNFIIPSLPVLAIACGDVTAPPKESVTLNFCQTAPVIWLAARNERDEWREIAPDAPGTYTFDATPRVSVAFVRHFLSDYATDVLNLTRDELRSVADRQCPALSGTRELYGSIAGITAQQSATVKMGQFGASLNVSFPSFELGALPDGPLDLIATRAGGGGTVLPDRVIVRRDVDLPSGATMPVLDFASAEALAFPVATLTFANRGSDPVYLTSDYQTVNGTTHRLLWYDRLFADAAGFVGMPAALRRAGDSQVLAAYTSGAVGTRELIRTYGEAMDMTFAFGPPMSEPTSRFVTDAPYIRPGVSVPSQADYADAMQSFWSQLAGGNVRYLMMITSAAFLGGRPATWELELPDMSATGYESAWAFPHTFGLNARPRGIDGQLRLVLEAAPRDGDMVRTAGRAPTVTASASSDAKMP